MKALNRLKLGLLAMLAAGGVARADVGGLPDSAISESTFVVVRADAAKASPELIKSSLKALVGQQAADEIAAKMGEYNSQYADYLKAGGGDVTIVINVEGDGPPRMVAYMKAKDEASAGAVKESITKDMHDNSMDVAIQGSWVVMRPAGYTPPPAAGADLLKALNDGLAVTAGGSAQLVFAPSDKTRATLEKHLVGEAPEIVREAMASLVNCRYSALHLTLGDNPGIAFTEEAVDEAAAKKVQEAFDNLTATLKKTLQDKKANGQDPGPEGEAAMAAFALLKPTVTGNKVVISIDNARIEKEAPGLKPMIMQTLGEMMRRGQ